MQPSPLDHQPSEDLILQAKNLDVATKESGLIFHGTGRYGMEFKDMDKSKPTGRVRDVLQSILTQGILPARDHIARVALPTEETISLTKSRLYARVYGEEFGKDDQDSNGLNYTFGDFEDWRKYCYEATGKEVKKHGAKNLKWIPRVLWYISTRFPLEELVKVRDVEHHKRRWYMNRINHPGNYPIVIGIDESSIEPMELPKGMDIFEVRHAKPITPDQFKIIEAPEKYVDETRKLVSELGLNIETLPMELCETSSQQQASAEQGHDV